MCTAIVIYSRQIKLTQGDVTYVGWWWYHFLNQWKWRPLKCDHTTYVLMTQSIRFRMHRLIMRANALELVDHENHLGLDNTPCNLRKCNNSENARNKTSSKNSSSKYLGVTKIIRKGKYIYWQAAIKVDGKSMFFGTRKDEESAAQLYDAAAFIYHGTFANVNFKASVKLPAYLG